MAQAAKRGKRRKTTRKKAPAGNTRSSWAMLLVGLVCGAILSGLYFGYRENSPGGFGSGINELLKKERGQPSRQASAPERGKPEKDAPEVKLEYHDVLPNIDKVISESELIVDEEPVTDRPDRRYVLQAGSYKEERDAESIKAKLALAGFEPVIQRVTIDDKGTYYRVRMGPYDSRRKLQLDQKRLAKQGINTLALRLETPAVQAEQAD